MAFPVVAAAAGAASLAGSLFGGGGGSMPDWLIDEIRNQIAATRSTSFVPDQGAFNAQTQSNVDNILAQLPVSREAFNTNLASRGIYSAGEAPKAEYADVYAPIARAATGASVAGQVGYQQLAMQGQQFQSNQLTNLLQLLTQTQTPSKSGFQNVMSAVGGLGDFGIQLEMMKAYGLLDDEKKA